MGSLRPDFACGSTRSCPSLGGCRDSVELPRRRTLVPLVDVMTTPYNHVAGKRVLDDRKPPAEQPQTPVSDSGPPDPTEARMRRALGLQAESEAGNPRQLPEQDKPGGGAAGYS